MKRTTFALFACAATLSAQNLNPTAFSATPPAPPKAAAPAPPPPAKPLKIGGITVTGSLRSRVETWDWFQPDSGDSTYAFSGNIFKLSLSQSRETWDWNAEFAVPFLLGLPANPVGPGTQGPLGLGANYLTANDRNQNTAMLFPKQLYVRITQFGASRAHMLKLGRFDFSDGSELTPKSATLAALKRDRINQRLIGGFGWSHVGRSFDGVQYAYTKPGGNFTFVGAMPTRGAFQTDGWGWNSTAFGYASYTRPVVRKKYNSETRVFGVYYQDWRDVILKTDNRSTTARRADLADLKIATFGGHSLHALDTSAGTLDLVLWGAAQTGKWGVQDHGAYAVDVEAGIQPKLGKLKPWLRGGYYYGSGDNNPNDNRHETFFQILPTPRPFARTPFFNMMNNRDIFGILILRPHAKVTVSSEFHSLRMASANDLWYSGGGVFQPWTFGYAGRAVSGRGSLANLYDMSVEYRVSPKFTLAPYFGYMQGLAIPSFIYPKGKNGRFGYLEATYRF